MTNYLLTLKAGDRVFIQRLSDANQWQSFDLTSVTNMSGWVKLVVVPVGSNGATFANNNLVKLAA